MKTLLIIFIISQLLQAQGNGKRTSRPGRRGLHMKTPYGGRRDIFDDFDIASPPWKFGHMFRQKVAPVTTTTKIWLRNDCDYVNYFCISAYKTGKVCGKTIYNTYDTFENYCDLDYMNCMENYDMWAIAHMGECYNTSGFEAFSYYAYGIWDDNQLEELYVAPIT